MLCRRENLVASTDNQPDSLAIEPLSTTMLSYSSCLLSGCCYGKTSELRFGVVIDVFTLFMEGELTQHEVEVCEQFYSPVPLKSRLDGLQSWS
jgi:hypothetical protein